MPAVSETNDTTLVISGLGIPRWAARTLTESLKLIDAATQVTRSINGAALNWSQPQFQKYELTITCTDQRVLAFDGIEAGTEVIIDIVTELAYPAYGSPSREVVPDSEREEGDFVFYRPRLTMLFLGFSSDTPEWEGRAGWQARFTEV